MKDAKKFLQQLEMIDLKIMNKLIEREQVRSIATGISASVGGDRVQSSGNGHKLEEAVIKLIDLESEIDALVDELIDTKRVVIGVIEKLDSPTEYNVLHKRYVQFQSLQDISDDYDRDYTWVTTTHGRALKNVQKIIDSLEKV